MIEIDTVEMWLCIYRTVNYKLREDLAYSGIESISIQVKVGNYKPFIVTSV